MVLQWMAKYNYDVLDNYLAHRALVQSMQQV